MSPEGSYSTASQEVQEVQQTRADYRKIKREVRRARATGVSSNFLRDEASRKLGVSQAIDSSGKKVNVVNIPGIGITDMATGRSIAAMMVEEDPRNKKGGGAGAANPPSLPSATFDICEAGQAVQWILYGYKVTA